MTTLHPRVSLSAWLPNRSAGGQATFRSRIERASLLVLFFGTALCSMLYYVTGGGWTSLPEWVYSRYNLWIAAPACFLGCLAYRKHGGFARSGPLVAAVLLLGTALLWTDETETGRGLLKFAGVAVSLPVAALITKQRYAWACQKAFLLGSGLLFLTALLDPNAHMLASRFGYMRDALHRVVSNPNVVGFQAALAVVLIAVWALFPERGHRSPRGGRLFVGALGAGLFGYFVVLTGSRSAFVTLAGTLTWIFLKRFRTSPLTIVSVLLLCLLVGGALVSLNTVLANGEGSAFDTLNHRLFSDAEDNVGTLGNRTLIWSYAWDQLKDDYHWIAGFGTGGVDKQLGRYFELGFSALGRDGIRRVHSHNTFVEWGMMCGLLGTLALAWIAVHGAATARRLDRSDGSCRRSALLVFAGLLSFGSVVNTITFWLALGPLIWAMLSPGSEPRTGFRGRIFRVLEVRPATGAERQEPICK